MLDKVVAALCAIPTRRSLDGPRLLLVFEGSQPLMLQRIREQLDFLFLVLYQIRRGLQAKWTLITQLDIDTLFLIKFLRFNLNFDSFSVISRDRLPLNVMYYDRRSATSLLNAHLFQTFIDLFTHLAH